jgi:predicted nucleotidyltransferase
MLNGVHRVLTESREENSMLHSEMLNKRRTEVLEILERYPMISNVRIVGSVARGEDTPESEPGE